MPELAFVLAPRQNRFFFELVEALRHELEARDLPTSLHVGGFPAPRPGLVYALVPPHEYFALMHGRIGPPPDVLERSIFVCAEQPGTSFFEHNVSLAQRGGFVFDINHRAVSEYERRGVMAEHLQLGYTDIWDRPRDGQRDIDVLFLGAASDRRLRLLSTYASTLWRYRCKFVISDNSKPNWHGSASFVTDDEKWNLLARSKVLINLHQGESPYFEWLRVVQAMSNGCVVVSETSTDFQPLEPGAHLLMGAPDNLALLVEHLLENPGRRWEIEVAAHAYVRDHLHLGVSADALIGAVRRLDEHAVPSGTTDFFAQDPPDPAASPIFDELSEASPGVPSGESGIRRALKDLKLDLVDLRREIDRMSRERSGESTPVITVDRVTTAYRDVTPDVSVLVSLFNYENHVEGALDSLLHAHVPSWEVVIVDDGSTDASLKRVRKWLARHEQIPGIVLRHPINRGLGHARNTALALARGRYSFVLDADNTVYPNCLAKLAEELDTDPGATFAYGMLERFSRHRSVGLMNVFPWEPGRLRSGNYIDAMAMIHTDDLRSLGGYATDRRLHGWEDFDLWARIAERGGRGAHVASIVARYRTTEHSMISLTNISPTEAFSIVAERSPNLMAGVAIPA